jgi:type VI secretion system protein ImpM
MAFIPENISRRWLAGRLAIWGKLPSHGDFLKHRTSAAQAQDWQDWVSRVWSQRSAARPLTPPRGTVRGEAGWVSLEPRRGAADLAEVPVAFVMQPGAMAFSPKHCVQGVMVASEDQVGRPCPLIIFQQVAPAWLRRTWAAKPANSHHDMLYWLARIAARAHAADRNWDDLTRAVDAVWMAHAPNWRHLVGAPLPAPSSMHLDTVVRHYCEHDSSDTARGLHGVHRMPWVNWPSQILRTDNPVPAFWQQDIRGGYVNASENLATLWGTRA